MVPKRRGGAGGRARRVGGDGPAPGDRSRAWAGAALSDPVAFVTTFAVVLLAAVLISARAHRTVLSTTVLFLGAGILLGPELLDVLEVEPSSELLYWTTEIALFAVLFTDGMHAPVQKLRHEWRLPARTLGLAMPLTMVLIAGLAAVLLGLPVLPALLLGAVLGPTDPVLAEAILGRESVPARVRSAINTESGLNDGLALPVVLILLGALGGDSTGPGQVGLEMLGGVAIGAAVAWGAVRLERLPFFEATPRYRPLQVMAVALLVFGLGSFAHVNLFLAAFTAGIVLASVAPEEARSFQPLGEPLVELLKLAAVLLTGVLFTSHVFVGAHLDVWVFGALVLVAVRPVAVGLSLLGTPLDLRERTAIGWFGPKGFASVTYSLLVLRSGIDYGGEIFQAAAATIAISIVAHSSTDVVIARWLERSAGEHPGEVEVPASPPP